MQNKLQKKIIFIINGEPLEIYDSFARKHRVGILISLCEKKHIEYEVWTSNFYHQKKKKFNFKDKITNSNYRIIDTLGYKKNISISRLIDHIIFAIKFYFQFRHIKSKNTIVFSAFPIPEVCFIATLISKKKKIPIVIDIRDQWPDIFYKNNSNFIKKFFLKFIFSYQTLLNYFTFRNCNAIYSITDNFLNFGLRQRGFSKNDNNRVFPLAYKKNIFDFNKNLSNHFHEMIKNINFNKINICFFGVISFKKFDFNTMIKFLDSQQINSKKFNFIICGSGDDQNRISNFTSESLHYLGWLNENEVSYIANKSDWALANYKPTYDFNLSIPNKIIEYISYGLPIIHSLNGDTYSFLKKNNINFYYDFGDLESFNNLLAKIDKTTKQLKYDESLTIFNNNFNSDIIYNDLLNSLQNFNE